MSLADVELVDDLLGKLDERHRYAVEARFGLLDGEVRSFREVGEQLGITSEAARRLVNRALAGLRDDAPSPPSVWPRPPHGAKPSSAWLGFCVRNWESPSRPDRGGRG